MKTTNNSPDRTMADDSFVHGDRVKIVAGTYKTHGEGVFCRAAGNASAAVAVKGDSAQERTIRLSSIRALNLKGNNKAALKKEIKQEISELKDRLRDLEIKFKRL